MTILNNLADQNCTLCGGQGVTVQGQHDEQHEVLCLCVKENIISNEMQEEPWKDNDLSNL